MFMLITFLILMSHRNKGTERMQNSAFHFEFFKNILGSAKAQPTQTDRTNTYLALN